MTKQAFTFVAFKDYAGFLLSTPGVLSALIDQYTRVVRASNIPLLHYFSHLTEDEFKALNTESVQKFLTQAMGGQALEEAFEPIRQWREDQLPGISRGNIAVTDITQVYSIRKQLYIDFADQYTSELSVFKQIVKELEIFHTLLEEYAFQTYVDIHQEALFKEKEFIASLINNSIDGVVAFDTTLRITEWNPTMEKINGLARASVLGRKIFDVFPAFEDTEEGSAMKKVLDGAPVFISERPFREGKGYYEAYVLPLYDKSRRMTGGISIIHDTTHRKAREEALEERVKERTAELTASESALRQALAQSFTLNEELVERENFLNNILDQSPLSTWIADAEGTQIRVNQACLDLFGVPDPALGIGKYNILQDNTLVQAPFYQDIVAVFREGKMFRFETDYDVSQVTHVDIPTGHPVSLVVTIFPIKNASGKVTHAIIQHEDVTEQKKAEEALRQSEAQLRLITDALPALITYVDTDLTYRFANREYETWFRIRREDMIGKHVREVVGQKAYENVKSYFDKALAGERVEFETQQDYGDLGKRFVSIKFIPHEADGKVKGFYALVYDISERKKIEDTLQGLYEDMKIKNEALARINTDLDNFIYMASHDLRSPITNMEGLMYMLQKAYDQQEDNGKKLLNMMESSIIKLKSTIDDLVEITKVQRDIEQQPPEEIAFADMLVDVKENIQNLIRSNHATIREDFQVPRIQYARSSLRSILYNLLSNAVKYRAADRPLLVEVTTCQEDGQVVLSVKDNGLGMSESQQKKLFSMFSRMHTHVQGTGIGLYTIKRIIENNKGSIRVHSIENAGTEFKVYFPLNQPAAATSAYLPDEAQKN